MSILLSDILHKFPSEDTTDYRIQNKLLFQQLNKTCIVIDDDPTGNQTVYNIPLLTEWDDATILNEFKKKTPIFYLLTNSRSLTVDKSREIYGEIAKNIQKASIKTNRNFSIISRSDSTLRGHFPSEIEAIKEELNFKDAISVFIPVMFEGGRVTVNDTHYVLEKENLIPVNETPFAKDSSFGYSKANLKQWIEEKTKGKVKSSSVYAISIEEIREFDVISLSEKVQLIPQENYVVFNALNYQDLDKVSNALLLAEKCGKNIIYRTSSSFVPSYIGLEPRALLTVSKLLDKADKTGGLTIVGSYVPKSSEQLKNAKSYYLEESVLEINVENILGKNSNSYLFEISLKIDKQLAKGFDVLVYTSRNLITGNNASQNLNIGEKISNSLVNIVKQLKIKPKYLIAKGGITSHDLAIKGLGMKRSKVLGQVLKGVPVWKLGVETKFPNMPYIIFPGNVGDNNALYQLTKLLK